MRKLLAAIIVFATMLVPVTAAAAQSGQQIEAIWPTNGWETAPPESAGFDASELALLEQRLQFETPLLSALVIVRDGKLVYERYASDHPPDQPLHVWSVSKSITNMAIGFALQEGLLDSLDQTLGELIPERIPAGADPRVSTITVKQLLTMTAGWAWDSRINFSRAAETDDLDLMMLRPLQCDPGTCFEYDSGCSNLLSYIIQKLSGEMMVDYLQPRLFDPLGISHPEWIVTDDGANRGGGGAFLTSQDMARLGYFALHNGKWEDQHLLSLRWFNRSTTPQSSGTSYLSGANIGTGAYGYQWWVASATGYAGFAALGYGGQMIYVVPELDLVVVTAYANADPTRPDLQQRVRPIVEELIVPAASTD